MALLQLFTTTSVQILRYWFCFPSTFFADNWQIIMQNRKLSLSAWFKLSWIYVTRLVKGNKIQNSDSLNCLRQFSAIYRVRKEENHNMVGDLHLMGRDNIWKAQYSDNHVSHYLPFSPNVIKALHKVPHCWECNDIKGWEERILRSLSRLWHASGLCKMFSFFSEVLKFICCTDMWTSDIQGKYTKIKGHSNKYFKLQKMSKYFRKQISYICSASTWSIKSLH